MLATHQTPIVFKKFMMFSIHFTVPSETNNGRNAGRYHHIVKQMLKDNSDNSDRYSDFEFKLKEESKRSRSKLGDQLL
jgi:hypothetical protein